MTEFSTSLITTLVAHKGQFIAEKGNRRRRIEQTGSASSAVPESHGTAEPGLLDSG